MKLDIVGGLYGEKCVFPPWDEHFGPGGRAAAALDNRSLDVTLHCYFPAQSSFADFLSSNFNFKLNRQDIETYPRFSYLHHLSVPWISPSPMVQGQLIEVEGDKILQYGFIEGEARVHGNQVVYDPQSATNPLGFRCNGSSAKRLAICCNYSEGRSLTGESEPEKIAIALQKQDGADCVLVKAGGKGCCVIENGLNQWVPPVPTPKVSKLGSGDIFSAEFAYGWMIKNLSGSEAAKRASLQTAYFCNFPYVPLKEDVAAENIPTVELPDLSSRSDCEFDVYLAGPFFSLGQRWLIDEARVQLRQMGLKVFSPVHEIGDGPSRQVAKADLDALEKCKFVFACLDGLDPGTVFEIGYANKMKIPVIIYGQDFHKGDLVMFEGTGCIILDDFVSAIYRAAFWAGFQKTASTGVSH